MMGISRVPAFSFLLIASLAAVAAAGFIFVSYRDELGEARRLAGQGGRTANTTVGPIEYAERGVGAPLLSIHGAGGGFDQGIANAADLIGDHYRIIAPSRFGYLGTPVPEDASPSAQADAHAALLASLRIDKAVVVGVSAGARSAIDLALRHPDMVAALVLIVPGLFAPDSPVAIEDSRGSRFSFWLVNTGADFAWWAMEKIWPDVLIRFIGVPPELVAAAPRAEQERVRHIVRSVQPLSRRIHGVNIDSKPDLRRLPLEAIGAPTLVISARDDLFNTLPAARHAASLIPNARLLVYDSGGHLLLARERDVRIAVRDFLATAGVSTPAP